MRCYMKKYISDPFGDYLYFTFRIMVALLFFQHGLQKLFGFFGGIDGSGGTVEIGSLMGLAGLIEFIGPLFIMTGTFTRPVSALIAIEMIFAYFMVHNPIGLFPIANDGEIALLFLASTLVLVAKGAGRWSLDKRIFENEKD
jgi:putative oxidoreductase